MRIEWSEIAFDDLSNIQDYIAKDAPYYADQFIDKLMTATEKLSDHPRIGREVPEAEYDPDIRELIFHSYRIIYQINADHILVVAVIHGSRDLVNVEIKPWDIV